MVAAGRIDPDRLLIRARPGQVRACPTGSRAIRTSARRVEQGVGRASLGVRPLPTYLTSFIGRRTEVSELTGLLAKGRLLTLTGVGGCGKTRLAVEVANRVKKRFEDGVVFVDLAPMPDGQLVPRAVAAALGLADASTASAEDALVRLLKGRAVLLVLDNCEHVVAACGAFASTLLESCPRVVILATSREPLNVPGERTWRVPGLAVAEPIAALDHVYLTGFDSVRLFVDRATMANRNFSLTRENAPAVLEVCRQLDGLPLGLELAAVRIRDMPVEELARRLEDRFGLLTAGPRTAAERQRTLRASIEWSHELLDERERVVFRRMAVFSGTFGLSDSAEVCSEGSVKHSDFIDVALRLVEKSLILPEADPEEARYRLLETVRQYAEERLKEAREEAEIRHRHADHFLAVAERGASSHGGPPSPPQLKRLLKDHENLRAALRWYDTVHSDRLLRLSVAIGGFWLLRGHLGEGRSWLKRALEGSGGEPSVRAAALNWASVLALDQGDIATARNCVADAATVARASGLTRVLGSCLIRETRNALAEGAFMRARARCQESIETFQNAGDPWGAAVASYYSALLSAFAGHYQEASARLDRAVPALHEVGDALHLAQSLLLRCFIALESRAYSAARKPAADGLRLSQEIENWFGIPIGLELFAGLAASEGQPTRALRLAGAAEAAREARGHVVEPPFGAKLQSWLDPARENLGPVAAAAAWEGGRKMATADAIDYALGSGKTAQRAVTSAKGLTRREWEIAVLVAQGKTDRELAASHVISPRTAEGHVAKIRAKLGCRSRAQIAAWVAGQGLVSARQEPGTAKAVNTKFYAYTARETPAYPSAGTFAHNG